MGAATPATSTAAGGEDKNSTNNAPTIDCGDGTTSTKSGVIDAGGSDEVVSGCTGGGTTTSTCDSTTGTTTTNASNGGEHSLKSTAVGDATATTSEDSGVTASNCRGVGVVDNGTCTCNNDVTMEGAASCSSPQPAPHKHKSPKTKHPQEERKKEPELWSDIMERDEHIKLKLKQRHKQLKQKQMQGRKVYISKVYFPTYGPYKSRPPSQQSVGPKEEDRDREEPDTHQAPGESQERRQDEHIPAKMKSAVKSKRRQVIYTLFSMFGNIENLKWRSKDNFLFVLYENKTSAQQAVDVFSDKIQGKANRFEARRQILKIKPHVPLWAVPSPHFYVRWSHDYTPVLQPVTEKSAEIGVPTPDGNPPASLEMSDHTPEESHTPLCEATPESTSAQEPSDHTIQPSPLITAIPALLPLPAYLKPKVHKKAPEPEDAIAQERRSGKTIRRGCYPPAPKHQGGSLVPLYTTSSRCRESSTRNELDEYLNSLAPPRNDSEEWGSPTRNTRREYCPLPPPTHNSVTPPTAKPKIHFTIIYKTPSIVPSTTATAVSPSTPSQTAALPVSPPPAPTTIQETTAPSIITMEPQQPTTQVC
ncbi:hypothetical protein Pelo_8767 [Pelomyxa schiedti]|nr:hypothetical protein Pelo_8767 [Pelomyxa schiedti]